GGSTRRWRRSLRSCPYRPRTARARGGSRSSRRSSTGARSDRGIGRARRCAGWPGRGWKTRCATGRPRPSWPGWVPSRARPAGGPRQAARGPGDPAAPARLFDLQLAASDPRAALATARQLLALRPDALDLRRVAQVAEWADRPDVALELWTRLLARGAAE